MDLTQIQEGAEETVAWLQEHPLLWVLLASMLLLVVAWLTNRIAKRLLIRVVMRGVRATPAARDKDLLESAVVRRLANVMPALVFTVGVNLIPALPEVLKTVVQNVASAFIILTVALALTGMLTIVNAVYERRSRAAEKPIKGYVQVLKIIIFVIAAILMIAALIDRSPMILLSGLGAMAAVLMLVFQDTLLSLVASMQINSHDIIRVGDWVEMPQANADGDVIDIALHTVKVQNFDRTITTIPTRRFISEGFKNWRGMQQSGGRRIMRNIMLDQQSVRFLSEEELERLSKFRLLKDYLAAKQQEISDWNKELEDAGKEPVNTRRITNIGTFRAYVLNYLKSHRDIEQDSIMMVRQLSPSADGVPMQIYGFATTTAWVKYEAIQSDIFDHLLAILPEFGLRIYQHPSGLDLQQIRFKSDASQQHAEQLLAGDAAE